MSSSSSSDSESSTSTSSASSSSSLGKRKLSERANQTRDRDSDSSSSESESGSESDSPSPEVIALSHAEKRKQKKKEKLAAKQEATPSLSKKQKPSSASEPAKRQNSVWVGNLSFKTTQDDLKRFFAAVGGDVTRINMPTKKPNGPGMKGENRGFAYVDFATPEAKLAAIGLSEHPLTGRKLLIKDGDDFAGRPAIPGAENATLPSRPLHLKTQNPPEPLKVSPANITLRAFLEAHRTRVKDVKGKKRPGDTDGDDSGAALDQDQNEDEKKTKGSQAASGEASSNGQWIRKVRMGTFEDSGLCKGFAFVDFTSIENATSALINQKNHHMDGRDLVVEYASAEAVRRGGGAGSHAKGQSHRSPSKGTHQQHGKRDRMRPNAEDTRRTPGGKRQHRADEEDAGEGGGGYDEKQNDQTPQEDEVPAKRARTETEKPWKSGKPGKRERIRPKPGAALALAKRESAAILPSQGKKIVF
ncbi:hypothetical protein ONZ45_g4918 [Pleurotus djamor]|nr:hypothetical protein ONZ45_g4918 [Pleurotus djamor]